MSSVPAGVMLTYKGKTQNLSSWAKEYGMSNQLLRYRLKVKGMSMEEALTAPINPKRSDARHGVKRTRFTDDTALFHGVRFAKPVGCTFPDCDSCPYDDCRA